MEDPPQPRQKRGGGGGGRGGGKNKGDRPPPTRDVVVSKKLSWLLRHAATSENLALDAGGYANLSDVLANQKIRSLKATFPEIRDIVADNEKQRFALKLREGSTADETSTDPKDWMIRANQGHSIKVENEGLMEEVVAGENAPKTVVHGTSHGAWTLIVESGGLKAMGRNHVHFAAGLPETFRRLATTTVADGGEVEATTEPAAAQAPVISGMRVTSTILIYISLAKAMDAGIKFWRSANGVILTEGDGEGKVGLEFFERVEDRTGEGVLVLDGRVVKEAPSRWKPKGKGRR